MASSSADIGIPTKGTDWNSKKVSELKKALTERNLPTTGNKALLIQRLQSNELNNQSIQQYIDNTQPAAPTNEMSPPSSIAPFLDRQGQLQSPNPSSSISRTENADEEAELQSDDGVERLFNAAGAAFDVVLDGRQPMTVIFAKPWTSISSKEKPSQVKPKLKLPTQAETEGIQPCEQYIWIGLSPLNAQEYSQSSKVKAKLKALGKSKAKGRRPLVKLDRDDYALRVVLRMEDTVPAQAHLLVLGKTREDDELCEARPISRELVFFFKEYITDTHSNSVNDREAAFTRNARRAAAKTKPTESEDEELKNRASRAGIEVPMNIDFANQVSMYLSTYQITGDVKILGYLKRILEGFDGDLVARPAAETSALTKLLLRNDSFTEEDAGKALLEAKVCCPHRELIDLANYEV